LGDEQVKQLGCEQSRQVPLNTVKSDEH